MLDIAYSKNLKLKIITPPTIFKDHRGIYTETYNEQLYEDLKLNKKFISDCFIYSSKNVLRGIHGDSITWKLVNCIEGEFFIAIVNLDKNSSKYCAHDSFILNTKNRFQILVPPLHGIGHLIISNNAIYHYKQTSYYEQKDEFVEYWNDRRFNINWPNKNPILSIKDNPENEK